MQSAFLSKDMRIQFHNNDISIIIKKVEVSIYVQTVLYCKRPWVVFGGIYWHDNIRKLLNDHRKI